ncbi:MAG: DUF4162 domain-containing protein, partial [Chloroflexota bacterium]
LDEPTSGVDPDARRAFWELIYEFAAGGVTVFVTTHFMDEAEHCNRIGLMFAGRLVALDTPAALKRSAIDGHVLEIEGTPQDRAREVAAGLPGVREVAPHGARLHAVVDDAARRAGEIVRALREAGVEEARAERIEPSLEDVFVALIGGQAG